MKIPEVMFEMLESELTAIAIATQRLKIANDVGRDVEKHHHTLAMKISFLKNISEHIDSQIGMK